jgi:hypothetical protein
MSESVAELNNIFDYFEQEVSDAISKVNTRFSDDTVLYLISMLAERTRADRPTPPEDTLAELHARAAQSGPHEQASAYRELGDRSLYVLGYFSESLSRHTVGETYYAEMGATAYHRVDIVFKRWFSNAFGPVFSELSERFYDCVALLNTVRESHESAHPDDLLGLYEKWLETGSEALATQLRDRGMLLPKQGPIDS